MEWKNAANIFRAMINGWQGARNKNQFIKVIQSVKKEEEGFLGDFSFMSMQFIHFNIDSNLVNSW